jgi:cytochrome o ubiquinol oxidase subunit 1
MKQSMRTNQDPPVQAREYEAIEMPKNSATGFVTAFFAVVTGFALIWHIWWMVALGLFGAFITTLVFAFREQEEVEIPAEQVAWFDRARQAEAAP